MLHRRKGSSAPIFPLRNFAGQVVCPAFFMGAGTGAAPEEQRRDVMITLEDGAYTIEVALTGGSGRADVDSPAHLTVNQGQMQAQIVWSSQY